MTSSVRRVLFVLAAILALAAVAGAQTRPLDSGERWRAITDGKFAYGAYCAGCHGQDGSGNGPLAKRNPTKVPDLRQIGDRPGGFDETLVLEHIYATNQWSREPMPAWGNVFRTASGRSDAYALLAAHNVMGYVVSIQETPMIPEMVESTDGRPTGQAAPRIAYKPIVALRTADGARLYEAYCASCHGSSGLGNGPAATALQAPVPDLTRIALRDGTCNVIHVREHIADPHNHATMPDWQSAFASVYSEARRQMVLHNLADHILAMQAQDQGR